MKALVMTVLGSLVRIAGVEHARLAMHRYVTAIVLGTLAFTAAIGMVACGLGALWVLLAPQIGPIGAFLIVGAVLALICAICAICARNATRSQVRPEAGFAMTPLPAISGGKFSGNGMAGLASAVIAGFIVGLVRDKR